jgi:sortase A
VTVTVTAPQSVDASRRRRRPKPPLAPGPALLRWVLAAFGALALWGVLYPLVIGSALEQDAQQRLFDELRQQLAQATAPLAPTGFGKPVALLDGSSAGLRSLVVVEGTGAQDLQDGPGHLRSTVLPGQSGTSVLLGKGATFGAPFAKITRLHKGDVLTVTTGQGTFRYLVERLRRPGDLLPPRLAPGASRLILVTAEGGGWRGGFAPSSVVYVDAVLSGKAAASSGVRPAVGADELPNGRSADPLLALVFWLQALLLAALGAVWLRSRWGRWQSVAVAVPLLSALALGASTSAAGLLPNLL